MNHYWVHSYNSTSSLLGGAVVAGDADNTAIYYNPATLSDMQAGNNFSLAANLFSWNLYDFKNGLGDGVDLNSDNFLVQPQFISYSYSPSKKGLSISVSILTRIKEDMEAYYSNSDYYDVLTEIPGDEKYSTTFNYRNSYNDTWIGGALAYQLSDRLSLGTSLFASVSTLNYAYNYSTSAFNGGDTVGGNNVSITANAAYSEQMKFTDYRLILKFGIAYKITNWKFGFTVTTPTWRLFSGGKRAQRYESQSNIKRNELPRGFADYTIFDGQEDDELSTNYKLPYSIGAGFIYYLAVKNRKIYFSAQYFGKLKGYKMVDAQLRTDITSEVIYDTMSVKDWTSFAYASKPIFNVAIGYSTDLREKLTFLNAVRTDFSSINGASLGEYEGYNFVKTTKLNIYHYSAGLKFSIKEHRFIAGGDFAFGYLLNQQQIANFTNPVEYDLSTRRALQGPLQNTMNVYYYGISVYLGATLNFKSKDRQDKK